MHELERRKAAVEATRARFAGRPHVYGSVDCVRMGAAHLREMGRDVPIGMDRAGSWRTPATAKRALARAGHASIADALTASGLVEIPPLALLPGDIVVSAGTHGLDAVGIWVGNASLLGFHEDAMEAGLQTLRAPSLAQLRAWRL